MVELSQLPHGWRRPKRLEYWLGEHFPQLEFVVTMRYNKRTRKSYYSIKAVNRRDYADLRLHRYIYPNELWGKVGINLLLTQLWLVSPDFRK